MSSKPTLKVTCVMKVGHFVLAVSFDGQCVWLDSHDVAAADWLKHVGLFTQIHKKSLVISSGKDCMSQFYIKLPSLYFPLLHKDF